MHVAIDEVTWNEVNDFIGQSEQYIEKFRYIVDGIVEGRKLTDLFDKEKISNKCKDVWAMKFFKGGSNGRLYCKKVKDGDNITVIVASKPLWKKKNQKNGDKEINLIEAVASFEYNIIYEESIW